MTDPMTRVSMAAAELAAALDAVRFAVSTDPELPALGGVLFVAEPHGVEVVATDRYRLATAHVAATSEGPPVRVVAPISLIDDVRPRLDLAGGPVTITVGGGRLTVEFDGVRATGQAVAGDFPDHRRVLDSSTSSSTRKLIPLDVPALRSTLPWDADPVAVLSARDGRLRVVAPADWDSDDPDQFAVNPEFLLQALDAGGDGQLVLDLDDPIRPLAIRTTTDSERFSVLMPIRR